MGASPGGFWQPAGGGLWSGGVRERGAPRELPAQEPTGGQVHAEAPPAPWRRGGAAQPVNQVTHRSLEGAGEASELREGESRLGREPRWGSAGLVCCTVSVGDTALSSAPSRALQTQILRGGGAWGVRAGGPSVGGIAALVQVHDPKRAPASPGPCGKGRGGRAAARVPAVGLVKVRRVQRVVMGVSGSAGTGRSRAIGTWVGGRPGLSSGRCRWSRGEAGWWRGIWLSCWRCTGGR